MGIDLANGRAAGRKPPRIVVGFKVAHQRRHVPRARAIRAGSAPETPFCLSQGSKPDSAQALRPPEAIAQSRSKLVVLLQNAPPQLHNPGCHLPLLNRVRRGDSRFFGLRLLRLRFFDLDGLDLQLSPLAKTLPAHRSVDNKNSARPRSGYPHRRHRNARSAAAYR